MVSGIRQTARGIVCEIKAVGSDRSSAVAARIRRQQRVAERRVCFGTTTVAKITWVDPGR